MRHTRRPPIALPILAAVMLAAGCAGPQAAQRKTFFHTGYAYAFLSQKAERIEEKNLDRARGLDTRAKRHYEQAYKTGLAQLEERYPGFNELLTSNPGEAVAQTTIEDVPLLYWTAAALGSTIGLSMDDPGMIIRLPQVGAMAFRISELQPDFMDGAAYELLMIYESSRPAMMGGSVALAKHYYEQALTYSQGKSAGLFVSYGEGICVQEQDREGFIEMMERALEVKAGGYINHLSKRRAKWLLDRIDDYFL